MRLIVAVGLGRRFVSLRNPHASRGDGARVPGKARSAAVRTASARDVRHVVWSTAGIGLLWALSAAALLLHGAPPPASGRAGASAGTSSASTAAIEPAPLGATLPRPVR